MKMIILSSLVMLSGMNAMAAGSTEISSCAHAKATVEFYATKHNALAKKMRENGIYRNEENSNTLQGWLYAMAPAYQYLQKNKCY